MDRAAEGLAPPKPAHILAGRHARTKGRTPKKLRTLPPLSAGTYETPTDRRPKSRPFAVVRTESYFSPGAPVAGTIGTRRAHPQRASSLFQRALELGGRGMMVIERGDGRAGLLQTEDASGENISPIAGRDRHRCRHAPSPRDGRAPERQAMGSTTGGANDDLNATSTMMPPPPCRAPRPQRPTWPRRRPSQLVPSPRSRRGGSAGSQPRGAPAGAIAYSDPAHTTQDPRRRAPRGPSTRATFTRAGLGFITNSALPLGARRVLIELLGPDPARRCPPLARPPLPQAAPGLV